MISKLKVLKLKTRPYLHLLHEDGSKERVPENRFFRGPLNRSVAYLQSKGEEIAGYTEVGGQIKIYLK